ncbi:MAG: lycopene cyclase domain-containing protein [Bacteroidota bacterium]
MIFTYLLVNLCSVSVPFLYSFHPKLKFNRFFGAFFTATAISAFSFLVWDAIFTAMGVWGFNDKYILGIRIFDLPLEEILFFICIPFACVFTYHCINTFYKITWKQSIEKPFILFVSLGLLVIGLIHFDKLYTSITFISTAIMLLSFKFLFKVDWLPKILSVYPLLLIPFFMVNGILTGTGLEEPVVWYNDAENLSIRMLTIPIEDTVYGFELMILTLFFYEKFKIIFHGKSNSGNE